MTELSRRTVDQPSIGELLGELSQDLGLLVRQEAQLARTEISAKLAKVTTDLVALAAGGFVALVAGLALTAAIILVLIDPVGLKPWLAALIVAVAMGLIGGMMVRRGLRDLKTVDPAPRRTLETIKEDIQWAKEQRP
ncbi:MAG TPA: phage holin family protein [Gemmatimonadales bacterium]|nr:phage holin family protein [Gemmatimonadales bacterium]